MDTSSQHDRLLPNESTRTLPFLDMEMRADFGDVYASLPRCFRGPITIHTRNDRIAFSPALKERTALASNIAGIQVYFVGGRPHSGKWGSPGSSDNGRLQKTHSMSSRLEGDFCGDAECFLRLGEYTDILTVVPVDSLLDSV